MTAQIKLKHSGGNGVIIEAPASNPASDKTIALPSTESGVFATKDSANSLQNVTGLNGGQLGNRNLIINGAMQVAQRATSSTTAGYETVDRFVYGWSGTDESPTQAQADVASGTTPYSLGFRKSYKITNGNQTSGAGAGDYVRFYHVIESQNIASSGWNYVSSSSNITLSFWIKSSVAQNFYGYLLTQDGSAQMYPYETGSLSANTWTKVTKTIPGNSNLQFDNDANQGFYFFLWPFAGTNFTNNSATNDAWGGYNGAARMKDATSTWYTTNDATFEITGVQLEVGNVATSFEHRTYAQELVLCQRYYRQQTKSRASGRLGGSVNYVAMVSYPLSPHMRNTPSVAMYGSANYNSNVSSIGTVNIAYDHVGFTANISDGNYYYYNNGWTADSEL